METKPGIYTTEFWVTLALQVLFLLNTAHIWIYMPPRWSGMIQAILGAAYVLSRGQAKSGVPADPNLSANYRIVPRSSDGLRR